MAIRCTLFKRETKFVNILINFVLQRVNVIGICKVNVKNKAVPLPPCAHQGGEYYIAYLFLTSAIYGGEWSAPLPGRALSPVKDPRLEENSFVSAGDQTPVVWSIVRHYTD
jgi:hypothetical protein